VTPPDISADGSQVAGLEMHWVYNQPYCFGHFEIESEQAWIHYLGGEHVTSLDDPYVEPLVDGIRSFLSTIGDRSATVLVEAMPPQVSYAELTLAEAAAVGAEMGIAAKLIAEHQSGSAAIIEMRPAELPESDQFAAMCGQHNIDDVYLLWALREFQMCEELRFRGDARLTNNFGGCVNAQLRRMNHRIKLDASLDVSRLDQLVAQRFQRPLDDTSYFYAIENDFRSLLADLTRIRDESASRSIIEAVDQHKPLLVIYGWGHIEPHFDALMRYLGQ
jgi:hypothetical protein